MPPNAAQTPHPRNPSPPRFAPLRIQPPLAERVKQDGHDIPEAVIRRRFAAGLRNFHEAYKSGVDAWALFDTMGETPFLLELEETK